MILKAVFVKEMRPSRFDKDQLEAVLKARFEQADFGRLKQDIQPFLADPAEMRLSIVTAAVTSHYFRWY